MKNTMLTIIGSDYGRETPSELDTILRMCFMLSLFAIIVITITTIIALIIGITNLYTNTKQTKINVLCKKCFSKDITPLTISEYRKTNATKLIKFNLITTLSIIGITFLSIVCVFFFENEGFDIMEYFFIYINNSSLSEITSLFEATLMCYSSLKYLLILTLINSILYFTIGRRKKSIIVTVCKNCGTIDKTLYNE